MADNPQNRTSHTLSDSTTSFNITPTADHDPSGSASNGNGLATAGSSLLDQAKQWLGQGRDLLGQLPQPVKNAGTQLRSGYNGLSTTQKVMGGALLVVGAGLLLRGGSNQKSAAKASGKSAGTDGTDTLRELLLFVNDRIEGYQRAVAESKDAELRGYYKQLVSQSQRFAGELNGYLQRQGGGRETGTTLKGKLYRQWMDAKAALTGTDEKAILGSNVYGEEWALKAYQDALSDPMLPAVLRREVQRQYKQSQETYDRLKRLEKKV
ncbi:PA2169 family four-helix-bundle protein [Hymenobacter sp. 15J16-1T3B]|uniref:ferritin-like domain-containing protein n=1 Tax=Hymenobacter sp. 15J16-1T3B TaxID=2886941 RepID=UPI001D111C9F|nr:PA2169 family four-helix-bundle protein [Hymenobacter sp. 15J16-1T3B]MCC3160795.1 PA2169 family four-helix-bundle protein [Hymenobacter sp. 15J16-1T3B]